MSMSNTYTCISCQIAFSEADGQRQHFQSDWHRYNLKRKVAELPPVSLSTFQERILSQKTKVEEDTQKPSYCEYCKKSFLNSKSYENHINSKKHIEKAKKTENEGLRVPSAPKKLSPKIESEDTDEDSEMEEVDSDEWEDGGDPIPPTDCLFCSQSFKSLEKNMKHMTSIHSFFVPDLEYCINLHSLIKYLGEKVGSGYQCLWCNEKSRNFWTLQAVQSHMRDKGHCMMKFEGETLLEYSHYYDYSSSYPDAEENRVSPDEEVSPPQQLLVDGYELVLPSGVTVGHRSLLRYYKQRINPKRSVALCRDSTSTYSRVMAHYKALGWTKETPSDIARRARDLNYVKQIKSKKWMQLGVKANKLQAHFRPQVMF